MKLFIIGLTLIALTLLALGILCVNQSAEMNRWEGMSLKERRAEMDRYVPEKKNFFMERE